MTFSFYLNDTTKKKIFLLANCSPLMENLNLLGNLEGASFYCGYFSTVGVIFIVTIITKEMNFQ